MNLATATSRRCRELYFEGIFGAWKTTPTEVGVPTTQFRFTALMQAIHLLEGNIITPTKVLCHSETLISPEEVNRLNLINQHKQEKKNACQCDDYSYSRVYEPCRKHRVTDIIYIIEGNYSYYRKNLTIKAIPLPSFTHLSIHSSLSSFTGPLHCSPTVALGLSRSPLVPPLPLNLSVHLHSHIHLNM